MLLRYFINSLISLLVILSVDAKSQGTEDKNPNKKINFDLKEDKPRIKEDCNLPPEKGPCRGYITRYYFDPSTSECRTFIYGGCDGNNNNFQTIEDCQKFCSAKKPPDSGNIFIAFFLKLLSIIFNFASFGAF